MSRVLVVDREVPQADRDGGSARMVQILRLLAELGHDVSFATAGEPMLNGFDVAILSRLDVAAALVPHLREVAPRTRLVYDAVHVEHLARYRLAKMTGNRPLLMAALADRDRERQVLERVDAAVVTSEEDGEELWRLHPGLRTHVVTALHRVPDPTGGDIRSGMVFLGFLGMPENELAARRLVDEVWPLVEEQAGATPLTVLGAAPPDWLLERRHPRLSVPGFLHDVEAPLRGAAVMVSPLRGGSGVKSKVLHAFARRLPVVATSDGLRGIPARDRVHVLREESNDGLAAAATQVLTDPELGLGLADRAAELLRTRFGPDASRVGLQEVLDG